MSVLVMKDVWENGPKNSMQKFVLIAISDFADHSGKAWPSVKTLAAFCSVNETTIRRNLRALEAGGWISTKPKFGRGKTNQYQISMEAIKGGAGDCNGGHCAPQTATRNARQKSFSQELERIAALP